MPCLSHRIDLHDTVSYHTINTCFCINHNINIYIHTHCIMQRPHNVRLSILEMFAQLYIAHVYAY